MDKKYSVVHIFFMVYKYTLKAVPFSGIIGILNYFVQGIFPAFTAFILSKLFDEIYAFSQGKEVVRTVYVYGLIYILSYVVIYILQVISSITINAGIYERCTSYYNMKIAEKTSRLPLIYFENSEILNTQKRAEECARREILSQIYMSLTVLINSAVSIIATNVVLATYHIGFIGISVLSVLPYFIARLVRGKEFYYLKRAQSPKIRKLTYLWDVLTKKQTIKEMRVMGFEDYIAEKWVKVRDEVNEEEWRQNVKDGVSLLFCDTLKITGYAISIGLALILVMKNYISIGVFAVCIAAFKAAQEATKTFLIESGTILEKVAFANDYFNFLDLPEESEGEIHFAGLNDKIVLENVSFKYPNCQEYALKNVSLSIMKGEKIVFLGVNGSGKTTLSKVIMGLYPLDEGNIYYDNIPISEMNKKDFYQYISAIAQKFMTYHLSLRENIAISDTERMLDESAICKLLKELELDGVLYGDLDAQMGREFGGKELSGGQWQKIAIARGLFKYSELIVIDEPTSALDPATETEILKSFIEIAKNKTAIIISHRVGLCRFADKIVVMKEGKVCEIGTHSSLISKKGEYYTLYTAQEQWYK